MKFSKSIDKNKKVQYIVHRRFYYGCNYLHRFKAKPEDLDEEHRIVYAVEEKQITYISFRFHYEK
ncbi:MAG: type II toxin-antitoxin system YoeB family toxin [Treponema sp.]|jgi:hypothetical protein|nr:type II toxin-antitoxin system YoeB family toxin [Treponema sp.]